VRRVEHEYDRGGALQYLAAWDLRRGYVMGRCEPKTGIKPFGRLVAQVMEREPYSARLVLGPFSRAGTGFDWSSALTVPR